MTNINEVIDHVESLEGLEVVDSTVYYEEEGLIEFGLEAQAVGEVHPQWGSDDE